MSPARPFLALNLVLAIPSPSPRLLLIYENYENYPLKVGNVSIRSRNGVPSRKGCAVSGRCKWLKQATSGNPPPPSPLISTSTPSILVSPSTPHFFPTSLHLPPYLQPSTLHPPPLFSLCPAVIRYEWSDLSFCAEANAMGLSSLLKVRVCVSN